jgi:hypothetical protein
VRISFRQGNPFRFLLVAPRREEYLARYVVREYERGRSLGDVLDDPYVRNRSSAEERARLLERPEVVAALGEHAIADLRLTLTRSTA